MLNFPPCMESTTSKARSRAPASLACAVTWRLEGPPGATVIWNGSPARPVTLTRRITRPSFSACAVTSVRPRSTPGPAWPRITVANFMLADQGRPGFSAVAGLAGFGPVRLNRPDRSSAVPAMVARTGSVGDRGMRTSPVARVPPRTN